MDMEDIVRVKIRGKEKVRIETEDSSWIEVSANGAVAYHAYGDEHSIRTEVEHIRQLDY